MQQAGKGKVKGKSKGKNAGVQLCSKGYTKGKGKGTERQPHETEREDAGFQKEPSDCFSKAQSSDFLSTMRALEARGMGDAYIPAPEAAQKKKKKQPKPHEEDWADYLHKTWVWAFEDPEASDSDVEKPTGTNSSSEAKKKKGLAATSNAVASERIVQIQLHGTKGAGRKGGKGKGKSAGPARATLSPEAAASFMPTHVENTAPAASFVF